MTDKPLYSCAGFALLRIPTLPEKCSEATSVDITEGAADEIPKSLEYLRALATDSLLREAVEISSPPLARRWDDILRGDRHGAAEIRRAVRAVTSYRLRMATRCTPFGIMAGVAPARFAERAGDTQVRLGPAHRKAVRLERGWVTALTASWAGRPEVLRRLRLTANNLCRVRGDRLVLSYLPDLGVEGTETVREVSVRHTPAVRAALDAVRTPLPYPEVEKRLAEQFPSAPDGAIGRMLAELVRKQVLLTDLTPPAEAPDAAAHVLETLGALPARSLPELAELRQITRCLETYRDRPLGAGRALWSEACARMRRLRPAQRGVQVDLAMDAEVRLPPEVAAEAERAADLLWRLAPDGAGHLALRTYHTEFVERYGVGRAVPVTEVLDPDAGLGPPAGYEHPPGSRPLPPRTPEVTRRDRLMTQLAQEALLSGTPEVVLDEAHPLVARLARPKTGHAPSIELVTRLVAPSVRALRDGEFRLVVMGGSAGPAAAAFGRFAGLLPDELHPSLTGLARVTDGERAGALHAQLVFQARHGRGDNVTQVPQWLEHRLPVGVFADPADPGTLALDDLAVCADPHRLMIVDTAGGREVVATVLHKLNTRTLAPNAARLLDEIGRGGVRGVHSWEWGRAEELPYVPRVRHGRTVLSLARWRPTEAVLDRDTPYPAWTRAVAEWRERWAVPDRICLVYADQRLELDLTSPLHLRLLRHELKRRPEALVLEPWDARGAGGGWLTGPDGTHRNELIIPLVARPAEQPQEAPGAVRAVQAPRAAPPRTLPVEHLPGGEWLYATVHCTPARQNDLLVHHLDDLLDGLPEDVDRWFFIRYRNPDDLLRLRFHGAPGTLMATLLPRLHRWAATLRSAALIRGIGLGTYDPELERYGGPRAMAAAERVFHADSLAAVEALKLWETGRLALDPVTVAALGQAHIARTFWTAYTAEKPEGAQPAWLGHVLDAVPRGEMHHAFQKRRREVLPLVDVHGDWQGLRGRPGGAELLASWRARTAAVTDYARTLRTLGDDAWSAPAPVFRSLLHMHHNRVIGIGPHAEQAATAVMRGAVQAHRDRIRSCP
ncbi:Nisin biosynthesis protein NisB [Streptomyces sp. RB17]|uniref:lantibiotic dehydratase n=1 Tax=Streptomyces sp. RB17 TaxID=2585197 RepID=UPI00130BF011|nr:lantibiotic dehydratase [Streptomyces sp. RB17]MQY33336.1 Nisin biosynthesis protein NisB [Streptomyces sp. RB17]